MDYYERMKQQAASNLIEAIRPLGLVGTNPENEVEAKQILACILRNRESMSCTEMAEALYEVIEFATANLAVRKEQHED